MVEESYEIRETESEYEVIPVKPIRSLEKRISELERATISAGIPQIQSLIGQIIELIKTNQRLIDEIVRADNELRNELSKIPSKIDDLIFNMKSLIEMIKAAGEVETTPGISQEAIKPLSDLMQKLVEQNQKLVDANQAVLESLDSINRKLKAGTPISTLMSQYPGLKIRREE
ncbi:MAG: hypothetical protein QXF15_02345 [Candidatus Aenigmatarchaeota archaeon]